ncbi:DUF5719 family protein [Streptomyces sp. RB6PN25]|uniref:DUF5719 family protein n=1 Tax=Streptomyces humicola TaxID=2953240 RepID=A0ABT1Q542_9ACTN|nr:DUF5719 family protein [Streptomyces humicola]MCQ4085022.1 DUF5719 family protein [Streptomyces humicola]
MNRTTVSLVGVLAALAAVIGIAFALAPSGAGTTPVSTAAVRKPIERSTLLCPAPTDSDYASTTYTAYTPPGDSNAPSGNGSGTAQLMPAQIGDGTGTVKNAPGAGQPVDPLTAPGKPVTSTKSSAAPLVGTATGSLAPGWTVQETTTIGVGPGRGVLGMSCTSPGTDFWFPGASTSSDRQDYVHLTNPDPTPAVADIELYDSNGTVQTNGASGLTIPANSSVPILLSTLTGEQANDLTVHVAVRTGRVGAAIQAMDTKLGSDWLPAAAAPANSAVLPGIPADATSVHLVAYATGSSDANLKVQLLTPTGAITPAGNQTLDVKNGLTASTDFPSLTQGQAGSLVLTPADPGNAAPFVAAVRITRGNGASQEMAFLPSTGPIGQRATAADNRAQGTTLSLAAPGGDATVKVTASAGTSGGAPVSRTVTVKGGTTMAFAPPQPSGGAGSGSYAVTVEPISGGPVYASRTLELPQDGLPMFTIQPMGDDGGTVAVPQAGQDLSILER